jgi:DNA-binding NtrC family response regulator
MGINWRHYSGGKHSESGFGMPYVPHQRMLVVDDDREHAEFVTVVANDVDVLVRTMRRDSDFIANLINWQPTIVALDLQMQSRNGLALLGMLHRRRYAGQVILMSAVDSRHLQVAAACAEAGNLRVAAAMPKPVGRLALRAVLERLTADL